MSEPRFGVTTVSGFTQLAPSGNGKAGLSAHVIDRLYNCHVIATFRSEDRVKGGNRNARIGEEEALARARAHAEHMNAVYG